MAAVWRRTCKALLRGLIASTAIMPAVALAAETVVLKRFTAGSGPEAVGMVDASLDTEITSPQALYAGDDNQLYLLDQVNGRLLQFDPKRPGTTRALTLPQELQPTDMIVKKGNILVWDGEVHALAPTGPDQGSTRGLEETSTRGGDDAATLSAFAQMGSQAPGDDSDLLDDNTRAVGTRKPRGPVRQVVDSRGQGPVEVDIATGDRPTTAQVEVRPKGEAKPLAKLTLTVRDRLGAVEFLEIDKFGRMYLLVENIPLEALRAGAVVARFSPEGRLDSLFDLPLSESAAPARRFVTISADGEVYFLRSRKGEIDVLGVGGRAPGKSAVIESAITPRYDATTKRKGGAVAVRPLTRQRVIETAFAFESIRWKVNSAAYGADPDTVCTGFNRVRRPGYLNGKANQEVRSIPYCWGCSGSLGQIVSRFNQGTLAGNVCTRNEPRRDVAGVDCSAFVSATWGLATHFTTAAIPAITSEVSPWDLKPGDALNKPNAHVMLFLRFTPDRKAEVIEASTGGCNGRVCRNVYPLAALLARGYTPVRYRALENEPTATVSLPDEQAKGEKTEKAGKAKAVKPKAQRRRGGREVRAEQ
jgi:hypothetical protein